MKYRLLPFLFAIFLSSAAFFTEAQTSFGKAMLINDNWLFLLKDDGEAYKPDFNDIRWRKLDLPHDWSIEGTLSPSLASCTGYLPGGIAWYRKKLDIPAELSGKKVFIYFEGVYNRSSVYINGQLLGTRPNGYVSFAYDLTPYLKFGAINVLSVRVDHSQYADSRWYTGSGIYRNVWLITSDPVHFDLWGVTCQTTQVTDKEAVVQVYADVRNETDAETEGKVVMQWIDPSGKMVAEQSLKKKIPADSVTKFTFVLRVKNPKLWSTENPNLYQLKTILYAGGKIVDESVCKTGIRTLKFDPDKGFALNGKWMKMKGVCLHHDAGVLGSAVPRPVWERRLRTLKSLGCNTIRMSHNLQAPDVYDLCDELGLMVMDEGFDEFEFPKKKWLSGWNVGEPGFQGTFDFFEEWSDRDVASMVLRDRNHPSVVMWSIGNEVDYPNDPYSHPVLNGGEFNQPVSGGYDPKRPNAERLGPIGKRLSGDIRAIDTSRPVTGALAGVLMTNETDYPKYLDVVGYNYTENRYAMDHKKYPSRIIYGSENGHGYDSWKAVRDNEYIFGQFIWTGIDYLGESNAWPSRGFNSGMIDLAGFIKPRGYFRMAMWQENPVTYIGTYRPVSRARRGLSDSALPLWNYNEGDTVRVVCYTNCPQSQLILNGVPVGSPKNHDDNSGIIFWDIPFRPGKLEVAGLKEGTEVARYTIQTSGRSQTIKATADKTILTGNKDLVHIVIQIVDKDGIPVVLADDEVTCKITGPARLLGLESANNADMTNFRDNIQRVYNGRMLAYLQTTGEPGQVEVVFSAPWLIPAKVTLTVKSTIVDPQPKID
jgi:beta-galactosidase